MYPRRFRAYAFRFLRAETHGQAGTSSTPTHVKSVRLPIACLRRFGRERTAASAVEFALVAMPFLFLILGILQVGVYYVAQSSLDAGVVSTANCLRSTFTTATLPATNCPFTTTTPAASTLKTQVVSGSGGMIHNDSTLAVEIRQLSNLDSGAVAITDGTTDYGTTTSVLVIRGQSKVVTFAPGFGSLANVRSSAIVRRQGT